MSTSFETLRPQYTKLLADVEVKQRWLSAVNNVAAKIIANKSRYQEISKATNNIPWYFIGAIHSLEGSLNFGTHLHNGDSLNHRTHNVPAGRPPHGEPPFSFKESAIDALQQKGLQHITDWNPERVCYELERYNGWGYRMYHPDTLSPYLWSGTNHYSSGKYVSDGVWSNSAISEQIGAMAIITRVKQLDVHDSVIVAASRKLTFLSRVTKAVYTTLAGWFTVDTLNVAPDFLSRIEGFMSNNKIMCILIAAGLTVAVFKIIEVMSVDDAKKGNYTPSGLVPSVDDTPHEPAVKTPDVATQVVIAS